VPESSRIPPAIGRVEEALSIIEEIDNSEANIKRYNNELKEWEKKLDFYGVIEKVECEVKYFDFSGHAGHSDLIEFAKDCSPEKIVLMHSDNREALIKPLSEFADIYTPNDGEILNL